jgi:phosphoadenosine phosphosulfate reductase
VELHVLPTPRPNRGSTRSRPRIREDSPTHELIPWVIERFGHLRSVITTAFGMEGCALIDMFARRGHPLTVIYIDTMFFFPETYALRDRMIERYPGFEFVNRGTTLTPEEQSSRYGPKLWKSDPDLCCKLRKVDPMREALRGVDVWVTALRRSQSPTRANVRTLEWDWNYHVLKFSPLARWTRPEIWDYVKAHDVPYNPLHDRGYPSIGCTHCTTPVEGARVVDYSRAGRWSGTEKKECGLHGEGI